MSASDNVDVALLPGAQQRDWRQRWDLIEQEAAVLAAPVAGGVDGRAVLERRHRLHAFYIQCYHLKDAIIAEAPKGVTKDMVEKAISNTPQLALMADLCNLDKHVAMKSLPRSGAWPTYGEVSGTSRTGDAGWRLSLPIHHKGTTLDGITLAQDAIAAWRRVLVGWGLL